MRKFFSRLLLALALLVCLYPFVWMFFSSFKTNREIYQPDLLLPADYEWDSYRELWTEDYIPFTAYFTNDSRI